ncbi:two component transcriptional regulator, LytTR family [Chitinophaga ginsengisegetis]|uniref:Two component transcriptional regulator, LytTR family n=1 Tax=Chitinophaga ginsengisegetis TaxID=393003 RepID=A0A1T5P7L0_9BACT|nr:LytTR family DNA-binding domain-containing protein [Chitinophaga ginsengisegetis]SKD08378.1 two component transcriptional regulator, LytTR family [Chitinophaga ginsengisegetis]
MRTIIVDDEKHSRDALHMMLERYCPHVSVQAVCSSGPEALTAIHELHPELVFLDIEMPGMDGFQVLEACEYHSFAVIFITAYDQYALQAIHHSALDYLLKPIDSQELKDAVEKAGSQSTLVTAGKVDDLLHFLQQHLNQDERLALPTSDGLRMVVAKNIIYCRGAGTQTRLHLQEPEKPVMVCRTLVEMEQWLADKGFFRVHSSFLINLSFMEKYIKGDGGEIIMSDGYSVPLARDKKQDFLQRIERL